MPKYDFVDEENKHLRVKLLQESLFRTRLVLMASVLTLGILPLLSNWFRSIRLIVYSKADTLSAATHVLLTNAKTGKYSVKKLSRKAVTLLPHYAPRDLTFFHYKKHFYYFSSKKAVIKSLKGKFLSKLKKNRDLIHKHLNGITAQTASKLLQVYKQNVIDIKVESITSLTFKLIFSPFSMFQIFALIVWYLDDYISFALLILVMMIGSIVTEIYEIRSEAMKIRELAHHEVLVDITRLVDAQGEGAKDPRVVTREKSKKYGGEEENMSGSDEPLLDSSERTQRSLPMQGVKRMVSSFDIAIGDIIDIKCGELIPADVLLISGKCLVDESTLTGETVPVLKTALEAGAPIGEANILSSGTQCLSSFSGQGLAIATGYYSKKGELVRSLLLADPIEFKFQKDALKFVLITIAVSTVGFIWFVIFIANGRYAEYYSMGKVIIKGLEIFTVAVPPALPLCLAIGNAIANRRLQNQNVYTRVLGKINEAGRVACACFDKTGTLTENRLILYGILPVYDGQAQSQIKDSEREDELDEEGGKYLLFDTLMTGSLSEVYQQHKMTQKSYYRAMIQTMGACHGLALFHNKVIGDPMEEQLFSFCGFEMTERLFPGIPGQPSQHMTFIKPSREFINSCDHDIDFEYKILRRIDFSSERKRMSVVLGNNKDDFITVITKGAPEIVKGLCDLTSLPFNFDEVLEEFTEQGLRVIAVGQRRVNGVEEASSATAAQLESKLEFIGFLMFQNPLKEGTAETIRTLQSCKINCKMITGDNLLTATSVGIATGIINKTSALFAAHAEDDLLWWEQLENEDERAQKHTSIFAADHSGIYLSRKSSESYTEGDSIDEQEQSGQRKLIQAHCDKKSCCIVMTGAAFDKLFTDGWEKDKFLNSVLEASVIFARTSPEQKAQIVEKIQKWYKNRSTDNWFVAFCGDGANDCSALKKADVGLSLSEAEASIAAPFNTTTQDISAIIPLFREGKASLETAFMNFKYILFYSFVQFFALLAAYSHAQEFANGHYYFMDLIVFIPLSIFICSNGTIKELNKHFPKSSLMKREVLFEIFGHIGLAALAFIILNLMVSAYPETLGPDESVPNTDIDAEKQFDVEVFGFFIMASVYNAVGALVFNRGYPFKVNPWKNTPLVVYALASLVVTVAILFADTLLRDGYLLYLTNRIFRELRYDHNIIMTFATFCAIAALACLGFELALVPAFKNFWKKENRLIQRKKAKS